MLEKLLGRMKETEMAKNTQKIVSIVVSTIEAKNCPDFFDICLTKSKNSPLERAEIV